MRTIFTTFTLIVILVALCPAASIDGKWSSRQTLDREGQSFTINRTFDLKTQGDKLTGTVTVAIGDAAPIKVEINDGKFTGNKFSFTVKMSTPNGDLERVYQGTVEGDTIKASSSSRDGADSVPFEAKRQ